MSKKNTPEAPASLSDDLLEAAWETSQEFRRQTDHLSRGDTLEIAKLVKRDMEAVIGQMLARLSL